MNRLGWMRRLVMRLRGWSPARAIPFDDADERSQIARMTDRTDRLYLGEMNGRHYFMTRDTADSGQYSVPVGHSLSPEEREAMQRVGVAHS